MIYELSTLIWLTPLFLFGAWFVRAIYNAFSETWVFKRLASLHGLHEGPLRVSGRGLEVWLTIEGSGKSRTSYVNYTLALPGFPSDLELRREGADAAALHAQGKRELSTGEPDFDDLVWIESPNVQTALGYLTEVRRAALLEVFFDHGEIVVKDGVASGKRSYDYQRVCRLVEAALALPERLERGQVDWRRRPAGWVNRYQRRYHAGYALLFSVIMLACAYPFFLSSSTRDVAPLLLIPGTWFGWCALSLELGWSRAAAQLRTGLLLLQWVPVVTWVAALGYAVFGRQRWDEAGGILLWGLFVLIWWVLLERWRDSLTRVRLGRPAPSS